MEKHNHHSQEQKNLKNTALMATIHCLTGCAIGEILGMVIGTSLGWHDLAMIILSIFLAFLFGYSLTLYPLLKANISFKKALTLALASDTISITIMEIVDNSVVFFIPGALHAPVLSLLFWGSLLAALAIAFLVAYPVNYYLIGRGKGHAVMHGMH